MFLFPRLPKSTFKKRFLLPADTPIVSFVPFTVCDNKNYVSTLCVTWDKSGDVRCLSENVLTLIVLSDRDNLSGPHSLSLNCHLRQIHTISLCRRPCEHTACPHDMFFLYFCQGEGFWVITEFTSDNNHKNLTVVYQSFDFYAACFFLRTGYTGLSNQVEV